MSKFDYDRNSGLGASDCPAVLGVSPWVTPLQLWERKVGLAPEQPENMAMRLGSALEPIVIQEFTHKTGLSVTDQQRRIVDPANEWRWATLDGIASDGALVEAKTTSRAEGWGEEGTDQIPDYYIAQVQHQMAVAGFELAWVPVLIAGRDFRVYRVERDEDVIQYINREESAFWQRVVSREAPPPQSADASRVFVRDNGKSIAASGGIGAAWLELIALKRRAKEDLEQIDALENQIKLFMGEASVLTDNAGQPLVTWKASKDSSKTDWKALAESLQPSPELLAQYTAPVRGARRFLIKGV